MGNSLHHLRRRLRTVVALCRWVQPSPAWKGGRIPWDPPHRYSRSPQTICKQRIQHELSKKFEMEMISLFLKYFQSQKSSKGSVKDHSLQAIK